MGKRVSDEDWVKAQGLFAIGKTYREISEALDTRASASAVCARAKKFSWLRGVLPESLVTADTQQIYERAGAEPEEMSKNTDKLQEAQRRRWVDHKGRLADQFGEGIQRLYDELFAPCTQQVVKVVDKRVEVVRVHFEEPPTQDKVRLATAMAILVDKASLLAGDATSRVESSSLGKDAVKVRLEHIKDELAARRESAADEERKAVG